MLPFKVDLQPGTSPYKQVVYAATKAVVAGEMLPGAPFPSVRMLSQALKINPNTAQKAVAELVREGLLEVQPGVGTIVAEWGPATAEERRALLTGDLEQLLVEAKKLGLTLAELEVAVEDSWRTLFEAAEPPSDEAERATG